MIILEHDKLDIMEWISVEEKLPEEGARILVNFNGWVDVVFFGKFKVELSSLMGFEKEFWTTISPNAEDELTICNPSEWMPLPEPPKE